MSRSKYESSGTENLKITYLLGAGASYYSNPIWREQGKSMIEVARLVLNKLEKSFVANPERVIPITGDRDKLISFFENLKIFGEFALEYGSIDIYSKRLALIGDNEQLNKLKFCLSVYYDIWENFINSKSVLKHDQNNIVNNDIYYEKIDKRYFALLSVLLEKGNEGFPKLNENISFLTWNYDLQLESSFETFFPRKSISFQDTNKYINFMNLINDQKRNEILHLNGFRGTFIAENKEIYETVNKNNLDSLEKYLSSLIQNSTQFKKIDYTNSIKYAWEIDSDTKGKALKIMEETNILVIIGYSFPAFNRKIDSELIKEFEKKDGYKKVYYQDPYGNLELINLLFSDSTIVEPISNSNQFHIPHEFLFPSPAPDIYI